jgi:large subunit ribosomal protein L30
MSSKKIEIKLIKSPIGYKVSAKRTLISLGLTKMNKTIVKNNTPQIQGMIKSIEFLLQTKEI